MKVTWKQKTYQLKLPKIVLDDKKKRSKLHTSIKAYLRQKWPHHLIYEEVYLPGIKLTVDFYLPELNLMVEAQGKQHYEFTSHFHKNKLGFLQNKRRDLNKKYWCEENNITLVEIKHDQWELDLRNKIG